jgi:hypothetical protein
MKQLATQKVDITLKWTLGRNELAKAMSQFWIADFYFIEPVAQWSENSKASLCGRTTKWAYMTGS